MFYCTLGLFFAQPHDPLLLHILFKVLLICKLWPDFRLKNWIFFTINFWAVFFKILRINFKRVVVVGVLQQSFSKNVKAEISVNLGVSHEQVLDPANQRRWRKWGNDEMLVLISWHLIKYFPDHLYVNFKLSYDVLSRPQGQLFSPVVRVFSSKSHRESKLGSFFSIEVVVLDQLKDFSLFDLTINSNAISH